jgi:Ca2+-binding EF-hand superfamily protein
MSTPPQRHTSAALDGVVRQSGALAKQDGTRSMTSHIDRGLSAFDEYNLEDDGEVDDLTATMLKKARELFSVCDVESKGFITKSDMQRLTGELPLTADQLEDVFDSLDGDGNGFLTLYEFTDGFGMSPLLL